MSVLPLAASTPPELWIPFGVFFLALAIALVGVLRYEDGDDQGPSSR